MPLHILYILVLLHIANDIALFTFFSFSDILYYLQQHFTYVYLTELSLLNKTIYNNNNVIFNLIANRLYNGSKRIN